MASPCAFLVALQLPIDAFDLSTDGEEIVDGADEEESAGEEPEQSSEDSTQVEMLQPRTQDKPEQGESEGDALFFVIESFSHIWIIPYRASPRLNDL